MDHPVGVIIRPGDCQHPSISDGEIQSYNQKVFASWGNHDLKCPDCDEWLYPDGDPEDEITVYVGEPRGAGDDPWGRPSSTTNPEYWTE